MTVDWHDHARVIADYLIFIKLTHVLGGVFIWDFVLNLGFEYSILTGKRRLTWTSPLYLGCRWSSLSLVIVQFLALDSGGSHAIDCQVVIVMVFVFAYLTLLFASALIALRVTALWEYNKIVVAIAFNSWLANVIIYAYSTAKSRGYWVEGECVIQHTFHSNISVFSTLAIDFLLLTLMLVGLLRWNIRSGGIFQLMYAQGLAWVLVVALAEIPPAVFIALNLNDPMNMVFQGVGLVIMSIGCIPHIPWTCQFSQCQRHTTRHSCYGPAKRATTRFLRILTASCRSNT
ncbi:hypothetical protein EDB92DRAFT_252115 [Lactarius akahatsu]|uniref:Uncharacterized protein n=1 Tax=Lactarius akahatsu TaxID=416441 RepID=A0AAD4LJP7_9AGAM|nr:hypothetical protein EDB92DRAFT_252115 [Lactarius akahatsu]